MLKLLFILQSKLHQSHIVTQVACYPFFSKGVQKGWRLVLLDPKISSTLTKICLKWACSVFGFKMYISVSFLLLFFFYFASTQGYSIVLYTSTTYTKQISHLFFVGGVTWPFLLGPWDYRGMCIISVKYLFLFRKMDYTNRTQSQLLY